VGLIAHLNGARKDLRQQIQHFSLSLSQTGAFFGLFDAREGAIP